MDLQGAEEMAQMEHLLNVYASRAAKGSIADFVGYVEVDEEEATTKLTQGIWLVSPACQLTMKTCSASTLMPESLLSSTDTQSGMKRMQLYFAAYVSSRCSKLAAAS